MGIDFSEMGTCLKHWNKSQKCMFQCGWRGRIIISSQVSQVACGQNVCYWFRMRYFPLSMFSLKRDPGSLLPSLFCIPWAIEEWSFLIYFFRRWFCACTSYISLSVFFFLGKESIFSQPDFSMSLFQEKKGKVLLKWDVDGVGCCSLRQQDQISVIRFWLPF